MKKAVGISIATLISFVILTWITATTWDRDRTYSYGYPLTFHEKIDSGDYSPYNGVHSHPGNFIFDLLFSILVGWGIWKVIQLANETRKKSLARFWSYILSPIIIFAFSFGISVGFNKMTHQLDAFSFLSGFYFALALVVLQFRYFKKHYIKAILLIVVVSICHAIAIAAELISSSFFIQQEMEIQSIFGTDFFTEYSQLAGYLISNLISISILLAFLSFIFNFKKWHRTMMLAGSLISTYLMYTLIFHLTHTLPRIIENDTVQVFFVFAFWQSLAGTVLSISINEGTLDSERAD